MCLTLISNAQEYNWSTIQQDSRHIINANTGLDNGVIFGLGYGYQLKTKLPVILDIEYSFPAGKNLFDDHKVKAGGQISLIHFHKFRLNAKAYGIYRRYENSMVRMTNFGSYFGGNIGYYGKKIFLAAEFGFDKAIVTKFHHSNTYKEIYPDVKDGWYEPATGGNYNYGIMAGYSFSKLNINVKAGKMIAEDFDTEPFLPFYAMIGLSYFISK